MTRTCEACGLRQSEAGAGFTVTLEIDGGKYGRRSTRTVWTCSRSCAWAELAINEMGESSHRWPVDLRTFMRMNGELFAKSVQPAKNGDIEPLESADYEAKVSKLMPKYQNSIEAR